MTLLETALASSEPGLPVLSQVEAQIVRQAYWVSRGSKREFARMLGLSERQARHLCERYGLRGYLYPRRAGR